MTCHPRFKAGRKVSGQVDQTPDKTFEFIFPRQRGDDEGHTHTQQEKRRRSVGEIFSSCRDQVRRLTHLCHGDPRGGPLELE